MSPRARRTDVQPGRTDPTPSLGAAPRPLGTVLDSVSRGPSLRPTANPDRTANSEPPARRRGPLPSPESAFARASFRSAAPDTIFEAPPAVLNAIRNAERVMVISHVPPDGDCVGTALGTARALRAIGKQACAVVDTPLPRGLVGLDDRGDLLRAADAEDFEPDLVLLVDVAQTDRIGDADKFVRNAAKVAIIDHHRGTPTAESLGLDPAKDPTVDAWIDEHADSASLMAASAIRSLAKEAGLESEAWPEVMEPLAAGVATDTSWFSKPTARKKSLQVFKHLLSSDSKRLRQLRQRLDFQLPAAAQHLLDRTVQVAVRSQQGQDAMWITADERTMQEALHLSQASDPAVTAADVSGALMDRLDQETREHGVAVLLMSEPDRQVRISIRSTAPEVAGELARGLGGGGKHGAGGAVLQTTIVDARRQVRRVLQRWIEGQTAQLRILGSA